MPTRSMSASGGNADIPDNPHQCPLMTHCGYGGATSQLAVPDFSFTPMSGFSPEACFRTYISGVPSGIGGSSLSDFVSALMAWTDRINVRILLSCLARGKDARTLESPQIESGDIVSGLTAGHQVGNQLPGHGRQCQANVLVPYRIEDRGVFETTDARKIVRKHRS